MKPKHGQWFGKIHGPAVAVITYLSRMERDAEEFSQRQPAFAAKTSWYFNWISAACPVMLS
jgi:hypothetical protein